MSYVYRRPFQTAQHRVARVEWQPQPLWAFDGVGEYWVLTEYAGTIGYYSGAAATFTGIADSLILTENTGSIGFQVPDVVPMSESGARFILSQAGFVVTVTTKPACVSMKRAPDSDMGTTSGTWKPMLPVFSVRMSESAMPVKVAVAPE